MEKKKPPAAEAAAAKKKAVHNIQKALPSGRDLHPILGANIPKAFESDPRLVMLFWRNWGLRNAEIATHSRFRVPVRLVRQSHGLPGLPPSSLYFVPEPRYRSAQLCGLRPT